MDNLLDAFFSGIRGNPVLDDIEIGFQVKIERNLRGTGRVEVKARRAGIPRNIDDQPIWHDEDQTFEVEDTLRQTERYPTRGPRGPIGA